MSRVGKKTITVPAGVTVTINGADVTVKGAKGELKWTMPAGISAAQEGDVLTVARASEDRQVIQSEVSQKEKHQYSILTHIYGI